MRVLIADRLPQGHVERLSEGHQVTNLPELTPDQLADVVPGHDVLVVRSTKVPAGTFEGGDLRYVIRAGAGTDTIDIEAAAKQGVAVCNLPGRNAAAVAELAVGLLLSLDRRIPDQVADLRDRRWRKGHYAAQARGLAGRKVGVIGLGQIGLAFAARIAAFDVELFAVASSSRDPRRQRHAESLGIEFVEDLQTLAATCDVLSFHVPLTDTTVGMIGQPLLSHVRSGTLLINTSRGGLVDASALVEALDAMQLWVGLDVHPDEPKAPEAAFDAELLQHPRVYGTHHVGASTEQAQIAVADGVAELLAAFERGELPNCVNQEQLRADG